MRTSNWVSLPRNFWSLYGRKRKGLPSSGHITRKHVGMIIYLKVGGKVYRSCDIKDPWSLVTDSIELIALGETP